MKDTLKYSLLTIRLRHERHVVQARQRAREIAAKLGFEHQEQIRMATVTSELARNAYRYATGGSVEFLVEDTVPQLFVISVTDTGAGIPNLTEILDGRYVSKTGLGMGIIGTKRMMEHFHITGSAEGTKAECGKSLPVSTPKVTAARARAIAAELLSENTADPFSEVERQNQELLRTLADLKEKQDQLADLNQELEDTNRGVVALYAELEQHADDLRRVSDLKTSFLSNLSHEFRTPLNSISSLSVLLLGRTDGDLSAEQEKQVTYIQHSASELSELVNDLLDLAKVEAGKVDVKPKQFEVQDLFGALRGMLKPLLTGNSLDLYFESAPDLPTIFTDEGKISQILRNLISNALKFTRKGHIRVTAEVGSAGSIIFQVADTGIGIAFEDQERIFEEFVQVEGEMQNHVKGTGLGLPLSRRLAHLLGGSIAVESIVGHGSTFTVRVPMQYGNAAPAAMDALINIDADGPMVLLIEDNRETSFVHQAALKDTNYRLVFVPNLPEARAMMKQFRPALIVLDRLIDQKDCLFFIEELRSQGYTMPVLVVSVVDDPKSALNAGAASFLAKPVAPFSLMNTVRELIQGQPSRKILLVDDDEVTRYLLGGKLVKLGYRILEAHGGRAALKILESEIPDAIMLDILMPDLGGFEVLREIRNDPRTEAIPIIIHSSTNLSPQELATLSNANTFIYTKQAFRSEGPSDGLLEVLKATGIA